MSLTWTTTKAFSVEHGVKIGAYSDAGHGKTFMIQTAPRPLIGSTESGLLSLKRAKIDIPAAIIKTLGDLRDFHRFCTTSSEMQNFDTICLDSISDISETILKESKEASLAGGNKDARAAYGMMQESVVEEIKKFRDLKGKHVYMTFKMEPIKDDYTGITKYGPMFPGRNLGPQTPYLLDEFFALRLDSRIDPATGKNYRYLQTDGDLQYQAKDRSGSLARIEPPDLSHVIQKIISGA